MEDNSDNDNSDYKRLQEDKLTFDFAKGRYDFELNRWNLLDTKASSLIGYVTIVTGLLIGIGTFDVFQKLNSTLLWLLFFYWISISYSIYLLLVNDY